MKRKLLGYYNYTVILTYIGMITGFLGIVYVLRDNIPAALMCLLLSGLCDMFDGAIASTMTTRTADEKCFGIQIDSLSDLICFGALPGILICHINSNSWLSYGICAFFILSALIRLAYFNVSEQNRQKETQEKRKCYYGVPVTTVALALPGLFELCGCLKWQRDIAGCIALAIIGILFVVPVPIKKPKLLGKLLLALLGALEFVLLILGYGRM